MGFSFSMRHISQLICYKGLTHCACRGHSDLYTGLTTILNRACLRVLRRKRPVVDDLYSHNGVVFMNRLCRDIHAPGMVLLAVL